MKALLIIGSFLGLTLVSVFLYRFLSPKPRAMSVVHQSELDEQKLWNIVNNWRESQDLSPYSESDMLCPLAEVRAKEISSDYSHRTATHEEFDTLGISELSENITHAFSESGALNSWLASPAHAAALRKDYKYSCIQCHELYCVQLFGK